MRYAVFILLFLSLFSCKKKNTPIPNNPSTPQIKDYSKGRMPLPYWGNDTLIGAIMQNGKILSYDSFITYSKNNWSYLNYKGKEYCLWIDSSLDPYKPNEFAYPRAFIGNSVSDSSSQMALEYYPNKSKDSNGNPKYNKRWVTFYNPFLNENVSQNQWGGRVWGNQ